LNKEEIISSGLLELYATNACTAEEATLIETHLQSDADIKSELTAIETALEAYAFANAMQPKITVQNKLFSTLNFNVAAQAPIIPITNSNTKLLSTLKSVAAAAVLLLLGSVILNVVFFNKYKKLGELTAANEQAIQLLQNKTVSEDYENKVIHSKFSLPLKMNGSELAPEADAKIYWLTNTGEIFIDPRNLPPTPAGKQYQLWAIVDGKAIDAGLIKTADGRTFKLQQMKTFGKAQAFAITLEVEGGVVASKEKPFAIVKL
jgi:anti-sigma-K factor RskA